MKGVFIILFLLILIMPSKGQNENIFAAAAGKSSQAEGVQFNNSSLPVIRFINASKLRRIPGVLRDLSIALNESMLNEQFLYEGKNITVYLYDVTCKSFEVSAVVRYFPGDTMYRLSLNSYNQQATDLALAATLIHEIMHCVLMNMYERALLREQRAIGNVRRFGPGENDPAHDLESDFFYLMNSGNDGQHELIARFFYSQMVSLLERFAEIHKRIFLNKKTASRMMWTGLQNTNAYNKLNEQDKRLIVATILAEKRLDDEIN
jgi:hypothetical protein